MIDIFNVFDTVKRRKIDYSKTSMKSYFSNFEGISHLNKNHP